jgi:hypothetical protein
MLCAPAEPSATPNCLLRILPCKQGEWSTLRLYAVLDREWCGRQNSVA